MFSAIYGALLRSKPVGKILSEPLFAVSLLFIWIAATRIFYMVLHEPMFGYGNQFDMGRTAACLDLWPNLPAGPQDTGYFEAPMTKHVRITIPSQSCFPSAEALLDFVAIRLDGIRRFITGDTLVDLRAIGMLKGVLLVLAACVANDAFKRNAKTALLHAIVVMLVLADPVVTLYFNTLYGEFVAVFGAYAAFVGTVAFMLSGRWTGATTTLIVVGVGCLAFSRLQHILLPALFIGWAGISQLATMPVRLCWRDCLGSYIVLIVVVFLTIGGIVVNVRFMSENPVFSEVNRDNMLFGALLPATPNPRAVIDALGLPPQCDESVHSDFFRKAARGRSGSCPEALELSSIRLLSVFAREPAAMAIVFSRGIMLASAWRLPYVGEVAGGAFMRVPKGPLGISASVDSLSRKMSFVGQIIFWLVPIVCGLVAGVSLLARNSRDAPVAAGMARQSGKAAVLILSLMIISVWTSSLLGDGYSELARHVHLGVVAALASWLLLAGLLFVYRPLLGGICALVIVVGSVVFLSTLPVAFGRLSEPASDTRLATSGRFAGWVIAPYPVVAVELAQGSGQRRRVGVTPSSTLSRHHPFNKGQNAFDFEFITVSAGSGFRSGVPIEVYAVDASDHRELVDVRHWCADPGSCRSVRQ